MALLAQFGAGKTTSARAVMSSPHPSQTPRTEDLTTIVDAKAEIQRLAQKLDLTVWVHQAVKTQDYISNIAPELRLKIYRLLLRNPILGSPKACTKEERAGQSAKYSLHPKLLRVSKKIYQEAFGVLYGENQFYFGCIPIDVPYTSPNGSNSILNLTPLCPILRYAHRIDRVVDFRRFWALARVQRWKVVISLESQFNRELTGEKRLNSSRIISFLDDFPSLTSEIPKPGTKKPKGDDIKEYPRSEPNMFDLFCRTVARSHINELEIAVILPFKDRQKLEYLEKVLHPLNLLRNVNFSTIRDAMPNEIPEGFLDTRGREYEGGISESVILQQNTINPFMAIVERRERIEIATEMWRYLLCYVQPFEPRHDFVDFEKKSMLALRREDGKQDSGTWFSIMKRHLVEQAIICAYLAAKSNNNIEFKTQRRIALEYLEPQYKRMSSAWKVMRDWAHGELPNPHSFLGEYYEIIGRRDHKPQKLESARTALANIIECFEVFKRDVPYMLRVDMRHHELKLPRGCKPDKTKQVIKNMEETLEKEYFSDFTKYHREAWQILEEQWLKIRRARKVLFAADYMADPRCYIHPGDEQDDEKFDWNAKFKYWAARDARIAQRERSMYVNRN